MMPDHLGAAFIGGQPASLAAAVAHAAGLLGAARFPLVAGLGTDIDGARAAIALAERLRGAFDHMYSGAIFNTLDVLRETGMMLTTPGEVRVRADTVLLAGPGIVEAWPEIWQRLALQVPPPLGEAGPRRVIWLAPGAAQAPEGLKLERIDCQARALPAALAALRARMAGRAIGPAPVPIATLDRIAATLKAAKIGVAIWAQSDLGALATQMLCGLVFDSNKATRFSGLPLAPGGNSTGVVLAAGWMTGFPMRTGFGRGYPEHDTWRFEAARLIDSGEADAALWIDAMQGPLPDWNVPLVALTAAGAAFRAPPAVQIYVGCPGVDHDGVLHDAATGQLLASPAGQPTAALRIDGVISQIAAALGPEGGLPC